MKLELNITGSQDNQNQEEADPDNFFKSITPILESELKSLMPASQNYDTAEISITFVDEDEMHALNFTYMDVDAATDVLSFPMLDNIEEPEQNTPFLILGDVVICESEMRKIYPDLNYTEALCLMLAHSFLHLLGFDHATPEEEAVMFTKQNDIKDLMIDALNKNNK